MYRGAETREIGIRIALGFTIRQAVVHIGAAGVRAQYWNVLGIQPVAGRNFSDG
jgi:hypothetical protein